MKTPTFCEFINNTFSIYLARSHIHSCVSTDKTYLYKVTYLVPCKMGFFSNIYYFTKFTTKRKTVILVLSF